MRSRRFFAALLVLLACTPAGIAAQQRPSIHDVVSGAPPAGYPELSTAELREALKDPRVVLLDVRPFAEFAVSHIPGALNVAPRPGLSMSQYTSDVAEVGRLLAGDRTRPLVLYCNGPFCGKSRRVTEDLIAAGYQDVRLYQSGTPVWRAAGGVMVMEPEGLAPLLDADRTLWLVDARDAHAHAAGTLPGARSIPPGEVGRAKDDGRLPMEDHNTRVVVFGADAASARAVAEEITRNAFHNVSYMELPYDALLPRLRAQHADSVRAMNVASVARATAGQSTTETLHESERMVARVMRIAAGGTIAEHHHPSFHETFVVQSGELAVTLDGKAHRLRAGDVVFIPAATTIAARNASSADAVLIVTWANTGRPGPLTVPGAPPHH